MCGNQADAEDLVQDVYVRAIRFYQQFQPGTNIRAWLFKILKNTYMNRFRRNARTPTHLELEESEQQRSDSEPFYAGHSKVAGPEAEFFNRQASDTIKRRFPKFPKIFGAL